MTVALVGAGPGDIGLVTIRALELVEDCDVLVYDRLAAPALVARARHAMKIARDPLTQQEVNDVLVEHGRRGSRVVRLKGGDPFLFGRGGEEAEALAAADVPYEIVPGVSALAAAPGLAGIPLTHRGVSKQITVVTGSSGEGADLDYDQLAGTPGTLVIFMGLRRLAHIADHLILAGRPADEPAAVVSRASMLDQAVVVAPLCGIAAAAEHLPSPSLVVIGAVVDLAREPDLRGRLDEAPAVD